MIETIEQALEILNKNRHRGADNWAATSNAFVEGGPDFESDIDYSDAIIVASYYELRDAAQPFIERGKLCVNPPDDHPFGSGDITAGQWRRLAQVEGEK